jgi:hypothetical protein
VSLFESAHESYEAGDLYAADIKFTTITKHFRDKDYGLKPDELVETYVHKGEIAHTLGKNLEAKANFERAQQLAERLPNNGDSNQDSLYDRDYFRMQILACEVGTVNPEALADEFLTVFSQNPDAARLATPDLARLFSLLLDKNPSSALKFWREWYGSVAQGGYDSHLLSDLDNLAFANAMRFASSDKPAQRMIAAQIYKQILEMTGDTRVTRQDAVDANVGLYYVATANHDKKMQASAIAALRNLGLTPSDEELETYASEPPLRVFTPLPFHTD